MTSGSRRRRFTSLLLALLAATAHADDGAWSLESLMAERGQIKTATARFVEQKQVSLLTRPLETSGTLRYVAPDRLEKHTLLPKPETMILANGVLAGTLGSGRNFRVVLGERPEVATLIEAMRATLAGDLPTLQRYFSLELSGARAAWVLNLVPRNSRVQAKVRDIRIEGVAADLKTISVHERDGDQSTMLITADQP